MKKIIIVFIICLLAGCSNNTTNQKNNDSFSNKENSQVDIQKQEETNNDNINLSGITLKKGTKESLKGDDYEFEITYQGTDIVDEVLPPEPLDSYYSYYSDKEDSKYAVAKFKIKNLDTESLSEYPLENFLGDNCEPAILADGKYSYGGFFQMVEKGYEGNDLTSLVYINPLEEAIIYFVSTLPNEAANMELSGNVCAYEETLNFK